MKTKKIFISDIHIGLDNKWSWFNSKTNITRLSTFLEYVKSRKDEIKDLVLCGDLFDTWVWPPDTKPAPISEIIDEKVNQIIFDAINGICEAGINVIYFNGNHDMKVKTSDLERKFESPAFIHNKFKYDSRPLFAEHGHQYDLFNAPDFTHTYPLGYFITRIYTKTREDGDKFEMLIQDIVNDYKGAPEDYAYSAMTFSLPQLVFKAVMEYSGVGDDYEIVMPDGSSITCGVVLEMYKDLYDDWQKRKGFYYAFNMVDMSIFGLDWFARKLVENDKYTPVIMGHTHNAHVHTKDGNVYYANTGTWIKGKTAHYVEVDKKTDCITTTLYKWEKGKAVKDVKASSAHVDD